MNAKPWTPSRLITRGTGQPMNHQGLGWLRIPSVLYDPVTERREVEYS
jgi:hypothetical protein